MKHNGSPRRRASAWLLQLALVFPFLAARGEAQTNADVAPPASGFKLPDPSAVKVGGVKVGVAPVQVTGGSGGLPFDVSNTSEPAAAPTATRRGEIVAAPVPFLSPTFGFGLAAGVGYIYHPAGPDPDTPPWSTGGGGSYAENGSWGAALGHKVNLAQDRWGVLGFAGYANVRYDFFGIGEAAGQNGRYVSQRIWLASL
jgi:hypothetical protein